MSHRVFRLPAVGAVLLLGLPPLLADPPADPLPKGAKLRLGTARLRDPNGWVGAGLTPDGKFLVGSTPKGFTKYDVTTGADAGPVGPKAGTAAGGRVEFTPDGTRGLTHGYAGVAVWAAATGKPLAEVKRRKPDTDHGAAVSADGKVLAVGGAREPQDKDKPVTALVWDVEKNEKRAEVTVLQNDTANVALSADGKVLATWGTHFDPDAKGDTDPATDPARLVQFWDAAAGKELCRLRVDGYAAARVVFSPDGRTAAVAHGTGQVRLIDPTTGTERRRLFGRASLGATGYRLAFSPDGKLLATGGTDGTVQLWGVADGARVGLVECPAGPLGGGVRGLQFTGPDTAVAWATAGSAAVVWEVPAGKLLSPVGGHLGGVRSVAFAAGGKELLTGGDDGLLLRWDAATGKELGELLLRGTDSFGGGGRFPGGAVQVAPGGATAVVNRGGVGVYDLATGRQVAAPLAGLNFETRPLLLDDARTLVVMPLPPGPPKPPPKTLALTAWDVSTGAKLAEVAVPPGDLLAAAISPDRSKLVTATSARAAAGGKAEFRVTGWDLTAGGKKLGELVEPGGFGTVYLAAGPDNASALVVTPEGKLLAVDLATGKVTRELETNRQRPGAAPAFGPGGKQVAVAFGYGFGSTTAATIRVYDWASGQPAATFHGHAGAVLGLAFAPDGKTLATGGVDTTVLLWDLAGDK